MTIIVLAVAVVTACLGTLGLAAGEVVVEQTRLGQLADETARAAAHAQLLGESPCMTAETFIRAATPPQSNVRLSSCEVSDAVTLRLTSSLNPLLQKWLPTTRVSATARAG